MTQSIIYYITLFFLNFKAMTNVSERNLMKYEADKAIEQKDYKEAVVIYQRLIASTYMVNPELRLDLAHAYYKTGDTAKAKQQYQRLLKVGDFQLSSTAFLQLGLLHLMHKDSADALENFRASLEKNPDNEDARSNYEWLRKKLPARKRAVVLQQKKIEEIKQIEPERPKKPDLTEEETLKYLNAMRASDIEHLSKQRRITNKKTEKDW